MENIYQDEINNFKKEIVSFNINDLVEMYDKEFDIIKENIDAKKNVQSESSYWKHEAILSIAQKKIAIIENEINNRLFLKNQNSNYNKNNRIIDEQNKYISQIYSNKNRITKDLEMNKPEGYKKILDIIEEIFDLK